ncbi:unnamed protein product [Owenia fusiformis]|uniref:Uncharacterized protein n=1 Tax=Owenia fusiformis TaxID=6347 RepID=A0A8J1XNX9_OWEFU|nr:unnamed protein product [Owenia fusiformis]
MFGGGSLQRLDAICAKLKTVQEKQKTDENGSIDSQEEPITSLSSNTHVDLLSGRKGRRKNRNPKNIFQYSEKGGVEESNDDEFTKFELNNQEADFEQLSPSAGTESFDVSVSGGASGTQHSSGVQTPETLQRQTSQPFPNEANIPESGILDLTVKERLSPTKPNQEAIRPQTEPIDTRETKTIEDATAVSNNIGQSTSSHQENPIKRSSSQSAETTALKDYAESTMHELLGIYGLENNSGENVHLTENVPMHHFTSGRILQHNGSSHTQIPPAGREAQGGGVDTTPKFMQHSSPQKAQLAIGRTETPTNLAGFDRGIKSYMKVESESPERVGKISDDAGYGEFNLNTSFSRSDSSSPIANPLPHDYSKYIKRFSSHEECGGNHCKDMFYKEHFHCLDCAFRVFVKKEEMSRHFKWHKKRDDSLQHGFMRYSPMDDCSVKFINCQHNKKQTHYHCLRMGCNKVYISTSDVQMHSNFHRKDSAIISEGFQRFRATEDCGSTRCAFYGHRTTHFHCRRTGCFFTFKNKADMEKHKTYHQKDEILSKDGFKKFMKYEHCAYMGCKYSKISNHIHCIRPHCDYVFHSTGQLYSHKRKHERRDLEHAYKRFKVHNTTPADFRKALSSTELSAPKLNPALFTTAFQPQSNRRDDSGIQGVPQGLKLPVKTEPMVQGNGESGVRTPDEALPVKMEAKQEAEYVNLEDMMKMQGSALGESITSGMELKDNIGMSPTSDEQKPHTDVAPSLMEKAGNLEGDELSNSLTLNVSSSAPKEESMVNGSPVPQTPPLYSQIITPGSKRDETWKKYITRYTANDACNSRCLYLYKDHYHCHVDNCNSIFKSKDGVREHARCHQQQSMIADMVYRTFLPTQKCDYMDCPHSNKTKHYHCIWGTCSAVYTDNSLTFARLDHHRQHEQARSITSRNGPKTSSVPQQLLGQPRKRGRPPKYTKAIPIVPKAEPAVSNNQMSKDVDVNTHIEKLALARKGFRMFEASESCPDGLCMFKGRKHNHCIKPRCHHVNNREDMLNLHAKEFHSFINILEGFEFFDRYVNCRRPHCHNNKVNRHFHCVLTNCDYSFVRYSTMKQHQKKHMEVAAGVSAAGQPSDTTFKGNPIKSAHGVTTPRAFPGGDGLGPLKTGITTPPEAHLPLTSPSVPNMGTQAQLDPEDAPLDFSIKSTTKAQTETSAQETRTSINKPDNQVAQVTDSVVNNTNNVVNSTTPVPGYKAQFKYRPIGIGEDNVVSASGAAAAASAILPLAELLKQKSDNTLPQVTWADMRERMLYTMDQTCGRPFCKLKKKEHFHCYECNQAFSDAARIRAHVAKHGMKIPREALKRKDPADGGIEAPVAKRQAVSDEETGDYGSSLNLNSGVFTNQLYNQKVSEYSSEGEGDVLMNGTDHGTSDLSS